MENVLHSLLRTYPLIHPLIYAARLPKVRLEFLAWLISIVSILPFCNNMSRKLVILYEKKRTEIVRNHGISFRHKNVAFLMAQYKLPIN